ncbi:MAG TPA: serine hydrolase domain-containing protein [Candidatus Acidoferrales bacterium]|nr:serine hydrolase domain-containing protein [Candidatus Acidoferrales bacterium]
MCAKNKGRLLVKNCLRSVCIHGVGIALFFAAPLRAQTANSLPEATRAEIDRTTGEIMKATGVPSAVIAIVRDNKVAYEHAYGDARLDPRLAASADMPYSVGSISKQFTATAILMLAEQGKLSLDDPVSKFLPDLTRARDVTVRQILSHTSGYQDYWPQDYVPPFMIHPITAQEILERWARKPLDFDPGTQYQYSNTNFVIAGLIIEKVSGMPFMDFLRDRIFAPLQMNGVVDVNLGTLGDSAPTGYLRFALGPPRPAPKEGKGWLYAAGELAMPVADLEKWDIAMLERRILKPESYRAQQTLVMLKTGLATKYGLGIGVDELAGHKVLEHGGEVSGFSAENMIFPDDRSAVIVFVNQDSTEAPQRIAGTIEQILFRENDERTAAETARARKAFEDLQSGTLDRPMFTANALSYLTAQALQDFKSSLGPLGSLSAFRQSSRHARGGFIVCTYYARLGAKIVVVSTNETVDGKFEQYEVLQENA